MFKTVLAKDGYSYLSSSVMSLHQNGSHEQISSLLTDILVPNIDFQTVSMRHTFLLLIFATPLEFVNVADWSIDDNKLKTLLELLCRTWEDYANDGAKFKKDIIFAKCGGKIKWSQRIHDLDPKIISLENAKRVFPDIDWT